MILKGGYQFESEKGLEEGHMGGAGGSKGKEEVM